jgi:hypothetical protein
MSASRWVKVTGIVAILVALTGLGFAEARWLHHLPADSVARVAVVIQRGAPEGLALSRKGAERLAESVSPGRYQVRLESQSIQALDPLGHPLDGVLLVASIRGHSGSEVQAQSEQWEDRFESAARRLDWKVTPLGAFRLPYTRREDPDENR